MLALLLLERGRHVSVGRLIDAIYEEDPPATARDQVQICASRVRRLVAPDRRIVLSHNRAQGYVLNLPDEMVDAGRFARLLGSARQARDSGDRDAALDEYRRALSLWRGPAAEDIKSATVQSLAQTLTERRLAAIEERVRLELESGLHQEVVEELIGFTGEYPLREEAKALLMLALYRSGRPAEALAAYRDTRRLMVDELGVEPGDRLRRLHQSILAREPGLDLPAPTQARGSRPVPSSTAVARILPADIGDFTGRTEQVADIRTWLRPTEHQAVPVVVVSGRSGVGKTTLAVHAAHQLAREYLGGQLFADFHAGSSQRIGAMEVLGRFLRVLGLSGTAIPDSLDERAELFRSLVAGKRVLVLLDDVAGEGQVTPLLPGSSDCAVIVTSRRRLTGLAGALQVDLGVLPPESSKELITRIVGARRAAESDGTPVEALAALCDHLPLAIRVAGARLVAHPHWEVSRMVAKISDASRRLDELHHSDLGIRASLSLSYESVGEDARRLFRRLAILGPHPFSAWVCGALLDVPVMEATDILDELVEARLVEALGSPGQSEDCQYRCHDLVRLYAREHLAAQEPLTARRESLRRVLGCLLYLTEEARQREFGADGLIGCRVQPSYRLAEEEARQLVSDPVAWFGGHRPLLVSGIHQAAEAGLNDLCWGLAVTGAMFFEENVLLDIWDETHEVALAAALRSADPRGQGAVLYSLSTLALTNQSFDQAEEFLVSSRGCFTAAGDVLGVALAERGLGFLDRMRGRFDDAAVRFDRALEVFRSAGVTVAASYTLHNLAQLRMERGELTEAEALLYEALQLAREGGGRRVEAQVLHRLGHLLLDADQLAAAERTFGEALGIVAGTEDRIGQAYALQGIGMARLRQHRVDPAGAALRRSLQLAQEVGEQGVEALALSGLAELALLHGCISEAVRLLGESLELVRERAVPEQIQRGLRWLAQELRIPESVTGAELLAEARSQAADSAPPFRAEPGLGRPVGPTV
ncbi:AfsR/SARP family transcriptional regulator [Streptomyces eurythermus]|uniref:AfsR/SARP family transcriptional regulator n=1 Tax=Streptomyces eurythermus TaxID=42237 RepID=UPI0034040C3C